MRFSSLGLVGLIRFFILLCQWLGGEATTSTETEAVGFFREDQLPELLISRTTPAQVGASSSICVSPSYPPILT